MTRNNTILAAAASLLLVLVTGCPGGSKIGGGKTSSTATNTPATSGQTASAADCLIAAEPYLLRNDLVAGSAVNQTRLLRFAQMSDEHIMDDDGQIINGASPID